MFGKFGRILANEAATLVASRNASFAPQSLRMYFPIRRTLRCVHRHGDGAATRCGVANRSPVDTIVRNYSDAVASANSKLPEQKAHLGNTSMHSFVRDPIKLPVDFRAKERRFAAPPTARLEQINEGPNFRHARTI